MVATALLLAATLALGMLVLSYVSRLSAVHERLRACTPSTVELGSTLLVYNACGFRVDIDLAPPATYNITVGNVTFTGRSVSLGPGEAAAITPPPKALIVDGIVVKIEG